MKELKLPDIRLTKNDKLWLNAIYEAVKRREVPDYKSLRVKLIDKLPKNFSSSNVDHRVLNYGERLTLIGIHLVDPKSNIINKTNELIHCIRKFILSDPELSTIKVDEIVEKSNLEESDIKLILPTINQFGSFWTSASGSGDGFGFDSISFENDNDNKCFNQYLFFECIEELINDYFEEEENQAQKEVTKRRTNKTSPFQSGIGVGALGNLIVEDYNTGKDESLGFSPIFQSNVEHIDPTLCFVLMPFKEKWSTRVFTKLVRPNIESLGLQCLRADNLTGPIIVEDIWTKINQSAFVIADVTGRNPNVMYELGIVHTVGKPAILMTQEIKKIPFDFTHLRHHPYDDNIDSFEAFGKVLKGLVKSIYRENYPDVPLLEK